MFKTLFETSANIVLSIPVCSLIVEAKNFPYRTFNCPTSALKTHALKLSIKHLRNLQFVVSLYHIKTYIFKLFWIQKLKISFYQIGDDIPGEVHFEAPKNNKFWWILAGSFSSLNLFFFHKISLSCRIRPSL